MLQVSNDKQVMALLVIDPYNDFISKGGKVWDRLKTVAEANGCVPNMLELLNAARKAGLRVFYLPELCAGHGALMTYDRAAVVNAVRDSDFKRFFLAVQPLFQGDRDLWPPVAHAIEGLDPSSAFRRKMLESWNAYGDGYRDAISDDLTLVRLMRVLLPRYQGGPLTLFRGEGAPNRRHRTYGMSWTTDRKVAEYF